MNSDGHGCGLGAGSVRWEGVPYVPDVPVEESPGRGVLGDQNADRRVDGFDNVPYPRVFGGHVEVHPDLRYWSDAEEIKEEEHECRKEPVGASVAAAAWSGLRVRLLGLFPVFGVHSYKLPRLLAGCEESVPRLRRRAEYCAKRMECAQYSARRRNCGTDSSQPAMQTW